jgi:DNA-binding XRE family transcriptional regulator
MHRKCYPIVAALSGAWIGNQAPLTNRWRTICRTGNNLYVMARTTSGGPIYAPMYLHSFPLFAPHTLVEAEKFNIRYPDPSSITKTADKLRWYRYRKALLQRDVADYAGIDRSTYSSYEETGRDYYPIEKMELIAELLEVPVTELLDEFNGDPHILWITPSIIF